MVKMAKIAKQIAKNGEKYPEISNIGQKSGYVIYGRPLKQAGQVQT